MKPILKRIFFFLAVFNFWCGLSTGYSQAREERTAKHSQSKKKKRKQTRLCMQ